jgi:hypothetical protein
VEREDSDFFVWESDDPVLVDCVGSTDEAKTTLRRTSLLILVGLRNYL